MWNAWMFTVIVSAVIGGLWIARGEGEGARFDIPDTETVSMSYQTSSVTLGSSVNAIATRRARIERFLQNIEVVKVVSQQMAPERAAQIDMVLEEMTSEAQELSSEAALSDRATDEKISELEDDLNRLIAAFGRLLEPEVKL